MQIPETNANLRNERKSMKSIRENVWLWGQEPGGHHASGCYNLPGVNLLDSLGGCRLFGIQNCCRVATDIGPEPPFDDESRKLAGLRQVVWSVLGAGGVMRNEKDTGDLEEVIRQAQRFPNVTGAVFDDFFSDRRMAIYTPEKIAAIKRRLNEGAGRHQDLWVVWYDREIDLKLDDTLKLFDVVTYWTWYGYNIPQLEKYLDRMIAATPGQRRLAGCYLWNYGEACALTPEQMDFQLETYRQYIHRGLLEGIVICSNCIADIGLATVEQMKDWIDQHGDEPVGEYVLPKSISMK